MSESLKEAIKAVMDEISNMTPEEFAAAIEASKDGDVYLWLMEMRAFSTDGEDDT